jgi:DnaJ family protein C protein 17
LDPLRRLALDAKLRVKLARAQRFKSYDNKRKNLVEELEERERAFKKARMEKQKEEVETWRETERIKEEGKKLREQKEKEMWEKMHTPKQEEPTIEEDEDAPPAMGKSSMIIYIYLFNYNLNPPKSADPLDTTVRLKYPLKTYPNLTTPSSIAAFLSRFGATDEPSIVLSSSIKPKTDAEKPTKAPKTGSALVPFKQIGEAFAAVCASGRKDLGLDGVKITWVNGKEPQVLGWLRRMGKLGTPSPAPPKQAGEPTPSLANDGGLKAQLPQNQPKSSSDTPFSSFPSTFVSNIFFFHGSHETLSFL